MEKTKRSLQAGPDNGFPPIIFHWITAFKDHRRKEALLVQFER